MLLYLNILRRHQYSYLLPYYPNTRAQYKPLLHILKVFHFFELYYKAFIFYKNLFVWLHNRFDFCICCIFAKVMDVLSFFFFSYKPLLKIEISFFRILCQKVVDKQELIQLTSEPFSLVYLNRFYRSYGCSKFVFPHTNLYSKKNPRIWSGGGFACSANYLLIF